STHEVSSSFTTDQQTTTASNTLSLHDALPILLIQAKNDEIVEELKNERAYLERFCNPSELVIATELDVPEKAMSAVVTGAEIFLPLEGLIDFDKEIERLEKELDKWTKE